MLTACCLRRSDDPRRTRLEQGAVVTRVHPPSEVLVANELPRVVDCLERKRVRAATEVTGRAGGEARVLLEHLRPLQRVHKQLKARVADEAAGVVLGLKRHGVAAGQPRAHEEGAVVGVEMTTVALVKPHLKVAVAEGTVGVI